MSKKFVPYEKLSKKKRREIDALSRTNWGSTSPVTRAPKRSNAYDRAYEKRRLKNDPSAGSFSGFFYALV